MDSPHVHQQRAGFTLIELLIVVAILGILGAVLFVAIGTSPTREARDARRVSDVNQLQLALTLYQKENGSYPPTLQGLVDVKIISGAPVDPLGQPYLYAVSPDASSYHLGALIENPVPLSYLNNDADFNSGPGGANWINGFEGKDVNDCNPACGSRNVFDVHQ